MGLLIGFDGWQTIQELIQNGTGTIVLNSLIGWLNSICVTYSQKYQTALNVKSAQIFVFVLLCLFLCRTVVVTFCSSWISSL